MHKRFRPARSRFGALSFAVLLGVSGCGDGSTYGLEELEVQSAAPFHAELTSNAATLTWDANSEADLAGYIIFYGTSSGEYSSQKTVGKVTSHTLSGLSPDTRYFFALKAFDESDNRSGFSNEVSATTLADPAAVPSSVSTDKGQYSPGAVISVSVAGSSAGVTEWIALYEASNSDSAWSFEGMWQYLDGTQQDPTSAVPKPLALTFSAPSTAGIYNIRYFAENGFSTRLAISEDFAVGGDGSPVDADQDGSAADIDCDDSDGTIHPGATDTCGDGIDQDCNGSDASCVCEDALCGEEDGCCPEGCGIEDDVDLDCTLSGTAKGTGKCLRNEDGTLDCDVAVTCSASGTGGGWFGFLGVLWLTWRKRSRLVGVDGKGPSTSRLPLDLDGETL